MASQSPLRSPRVAFWLGVSVSFVSTSATVVFLTIVAIALFVGDIPSRPAPVVALALEALSLLTLSALAWREGSRIRPSSDSQFNARPSYRHKDVLITSLFTSSAGIATLITIVWMGLELSDIPTIIGLHPTILLACVTAAFALSAISNVIVLAALVLSRRADDEIIRLPPPTTTSITISMTQRPETSTSFTSNPFASPVDASPPHTPTSTTYSIRSSFTLPKRHGSTKSAVAVTTAAEQQHHPARPASQPHSEASSFDSWDTSSVAPSLRDAIHTSVRAIALPRISTAPKLPPIPGSRPVSPAKALDGPFLPPSPHPSQSPVTSPRLTPGSPPPPPPPPPPSQPSSSNRITRSVSLHHTPSAASLPPPNPPFAFAGASSSRSPSPANSTSSLPLSSTAPILGRNYSQTSLADSVSHLGFRGTPGFVEEENIHPLFRSTNPTPPPGTTQGTVVTAASIGEALGIGTSEGVRSRAASVDGRGSRSGSVRSVSLGKEREREREREEDGRREGSPGLGGGRKASGDRNPTSPLGRDWGDSGWDGPPVVRSESIKEEPGERES